MGQKVNPTNLRLKTNNTAYNRWFLNEGYEKTLHEDFLIKEYLTHVFLTAYALKGHMIIKRNSESISIYGFMYSTKSSYIQKIVESGYLVQVTNTLKALTRTTVNLFLVDANPFFYEKLNSVNSSKNSRFLISNREKKIGSKFARIKAAMPKKFLQFRNRPYFNSLFNILHASIGSRNVNIFSDFIVDQLQKDYKHNLFLDFLGKVMHEAVSLYPMLKGIKVQIKGRVNGSERSRKETFQVGNISLQTISSNVKYIYKPVFTIYGVCGLKVWMCFDKITS
jgi:ribosomal protein S3